MYKIAIIYAGATYESALNHIRLQELLGKIKVIGIGTQDIYAEYVDGYPVTTIENILQQEWDYLLIAGQEQNFAQMKALLVSIGIEADRIFSIMVFSLPMFDMEEYVQFVNKKVSIISNHCWGGFTYHSLKAEFLSPFINMFIPQADYIRLLESFDAYMNEKVKYYKNEYESNLKREYPVALLGDIELHFNHYKSFEEAEQKWYERKQRMNEERLFVEMQTDSEELAERFDKLPFKQKVVFVPFETKLTSAISLKRINANYSGAFYESVNRLATGQQAFYNILKLLNGERDFFRVSEKM